MHETRRRKEESCLRPARPDSARVVGKRRERARKVQIAKYKVKERAQRNTNVVCELAR